MLKALRFILYLLVLLAGKAYSQSINVTGKIIDKETKLPVQGVNVNVYKEKDIIYHTTTNKEGSFIIPGNLFKQPNYIAVSSLNYDELRIAPKSPNKNSDNNDSIDLGIFKIKPHQIELNEVKIQARKRYRDTIKIDLSGQKFERSVMIDDLFSTNGFSKDKNGILYYKGKIVSDLKVNGGDFFGKNNMSIYNLLPALVLDNIEVVETNIDSLTNTTNLRPTIKINLKLKEKYNKGVFGNANLGLGTAKRYLAGTDLYTYKKKQQILLGFNTNNINLSDLPTSEPVISFSTNGNNSTTKNVKFSYSNTFSKKIDVDFLTKAKIEHKDYESDVERQEEIANQFSKITNKTNTKTWGIPYAKLTINYKIDTLNNLSFTQTNDYNKNIQHDLSNYQINLNEQNSISNLNKTQKIINSNSLTELLYTKRFAKSGRLLNITLGRNATNINNNEIDSVSNLINQISKSYFVRGNRNSNQTDYAVNTTFTESLGTEAYVNTFLNYKNNKINYRPDIVSDSLKDILNAPVVVSNQYIQSGIKLQKTFNKSSLNGSVAGLIDFRNNSMIHKNSQSTFFNIDADIKFDYRINDKTNYALSYKTTTNYPEASQLINVNNSFDLISQTTSNLDIKPEVKNSIKFDYSSRKSESESLNLNANFDLYSGKFGQVINFLPDAPQSVYIANIGIAKAAGFGLFFLKNISDKFYFSYNNTIFYHEQPTIINNKLNLNNSVTINQTISTTKEVIKNVLTVSPVLTVTYSKYYFEASNSSIVGLIYSDKFSFIVASFQLDLYPLINYSHSINNTTSFSMNGAIKRSLFNRYGTIWIQGYDLFNSFKFANNFFGASYTQTLKYSNIKRYFVIGLSYKFNNMK